MSVFSETVPFKIPTTKNLFLALLFYLATRELKLSRPRHICTAISGVAWRRRHRLSQLHPAHSTPFTALLWPTSCKTRRAQITIQLQIIYSSKCSCFDCGIYLVQPLALARFNYLNACGFLTLARTCYFPILERTWGGGLQSPCYSLPVP